jgi:hypothetical protein
VQRKITSFPRKMDLSLSPDMLKAILSELIGVCQKQGIDVSHVEAKTEVSPEFITELPRFAQEVQKRKNDKNEKTRGTSTRESYLSRRQARESGHLDRAAGGQCGYRRFGCVGQ